VKQQQQRWWRGLLWQQQQPGNSKTVLLQPRAVPGIQRSLSGALKYIISRASVLVYVLFLFLGFLAGA
jgi:hypothetical protein